MHYEKELDRLNEYQREAVLDESNACIVNANVGSGKTTVLITKILYLHYAKNISYKDMIVLTFTNKAANEIKERLTSIDTSINSDDLNGFGTFHSVALNLLKNVLPLDNIGYKSDFFVIEPEEELDIALEIIQENNLKIKYKNRLSSRLEQANMIEKEEEKISKYGDDIFKLIDLLKEEKIKQNKMSFSDILQNAKVLLDNPKVKNMEVSDILSNSKVPVDTPRNRIAETSDTEKNSIAPKWIIIDEVQDSDKLQLDFIEKLKTEDTKLFAVGDSNQVIYSWRGGSLNVVYSLLYKYKARELSLPINYRSSNLIIEAARRFQQSGDKLIGVRDSGDKIVVKNHYNPFNEACYLADKIKELHKSGVKYNEIAIFYRLQNQSQVIEDVFTKNDVPYEVSMKRNIRDIPVLNWLIKLLRYSINPNDVTSAVYVLTNKDYGERMTDKGAKEIIKEQNLWMSALFTKMYNFLSECSNPKTSLDIYNYFEFDYYIKPTSSTYLEDKESINSLLNIIMEYVEENNMTFIDGLKEFINSQSLYGVNILKQDIKLNSDSVKLMTLHSSKGLEFSHVFIIGVNYGLIPLHTKNEEEEEEEQRLFFVGITRAKDYLELSYYTNPDYVRATGGESRYINRIPKELIENNSTQNATVNLHELKKQIQEEKLKSRNKSAKTQDNIETESTTIESIEDSTQISDNISTKIQSSDNKYSEIETIINNETPEQIEASEEKETESNIKQVRHDKYGVGTVIREDDTMIEIDFEGYGVKEFIKAFTMLEYL